MYIRYLFMGISIFLEKDYQNWETSSRYPNTPGSWLLVPDSSTIYPQNTEQIYNVFSSMFKILCMSLNNNVDI